MPGEEKACPRCGAPFVCNRTEIALCGCSQAKLSVAARDFLAGTQYGCLCNACLAHYNELLARTKGLEFPAWAGDLVEGLHYYKEDGFRVFTELYHVLRGRCCRNQCRHCPYGFKRSMLR